MTDRRLPTPSSSAPGASADSSAEGPSASVPPPGRAGTDRRTFIKRGLAAGGALAAGGGAFAALSGGGRGRARAAARVTSSAAARGATAARTRQPNILVIVVDQMRSPSWFPATAALDRLLPNIARLRRQSVSFARHYTASNDCTPARAALLTGLYTHQTGCLITGASTLDRAFPTYGTMLREHGYRTNWYGKWHLTRGDHRWTRARAGALEAYGFSGGTFPSPDGGPGQGWHIDPHITRQFERWFARAGHRGPWCTTVSLVNPHDIAWWYGWTDRVPPEAAAPPSFARLPPNFETPEAMMARNKPQLQRSLQDTAAASFGPVPFDGPGVAQAWLPFLDLYMKLQRQVDHHVGRVLSTLARRPDVAANTVVLFTSDHGEYGSSHGLRGKGAGVYEEAIRVPLMVSDPRGVLTTALRSTRAQLTSSVDVAPLLLTIARGSGAWRREESYAHLARRLDLASILADPSASGRPYVVHATDEIVTEYASTPYAAAAPLHVTAVRTPTAKYATYSHWSPDTTDVQTAGQERELYDYSMHGGRLELDNGVGQSQLEEGLHTLLASAVAQELREPLPAPLRAAQARGFSDYAFANARAATSASLQRALREATGHAARHPHPPTHGLHGSREPFVAPSGPMGPAGLRGPHVPHPPPGLKRPPEALASGSPGSGRRRRRRPLRPR
jgi:arylsulfatase A-like enzyme